MCLDPFPFSFRSVMSPSPCWLTTKSSTSLIFYALSAFNKWFQNERVRKHAMLPRHKLWKQCLAFSVVCCPIQLCRPWKNGRHPRGYSTNTPKKSDKKHENKEEIHWELFYLVNYSLPPQAFNVSVMSYVCTASLIFTTVELRTV